MTVVGLVMLLALVILGIPIYMAILISSIFIISFGLGVDIWFPLSEMFSRVAVFSLLAVPMFVFLGSLLAMGGAGKSLIRVMNAFLGHIPGGPAYALVFASVIVAAMCAHPMAAIAGFGPIIVPMLIELGYSEVFAVGLLMASASLAPLIPPNTIAFIYAVVANPVASETIDVKVLWTASIIPGLVLALLLCITVFVYSRIGHFKSLPKSSWSERWAALKDAFWVAVTPAVILVPLYGGWANPTEVGALGVVYIALICYFKYHSINPKMLWQSSMSTLRVLGVIFLIIMASLLLSYVVVRAHVPQDLTEWLADMNLNWWTFTAIMIVIFMLMGMFLDPSAIVMISVPMLIVTVESMGINLYVFGVFTSIAVTLAGITPPYGLTLFATQSLLGKPYHVVAKASLVFVPGLLLGLILIGFISQLSTWLPRLWDQIP